MHLFRSFSIFYFAVTMVQGVTQLFPPGSNQHFLHLKNLHLLDWQTATKELELIVQRRTRIKHEINNEHPFFSMQFFPIFISLEPLCTALHRYSDPNQHFLHLLYHLQSLDWQTASLRHHPVHFLGEHTFTSPGKLRFLQNWPGGQWESLLHSEHFKSSREQ